MSLNLKGALRNAGKGEINYLSDEDGNFITDKEAREYINECISKGYKLMPVPSCEGFDPYEKGCPGHDITE